MGEQETGKIVIGVIGSDGQDSGSPIPPIALIIAEEVGSSIAKRCGILVTGGGEGVLQAASRGAYTAGGIVVGILPGHSKSEANPYVTIPLATGLEYMRNVLIVRASDALIMICGGNETYQEAVISYGRKPLIVVEGTGGWSDRLRQTLYNEKYFDERGSGEVIYVTTSDAAVSKAFELANTFRPKEGFNASSKLLDPS